MALAGCGGGGGSSPGAVTPPPSGGTTGERIVFVSSRDRTADGNLNKEIYSARPDGSDAKRLTAGDGVDVSPCWSPDRRFIYFASDRDGNYAIYRMNGDGSGVLKVSQGAELNASPACSPDGTRLAFVSWTARGAEIFVMNADGTGRRQLTENDVNDGGPVWSPDGTQIYYSSMQDGVTQKSYLYVMNADGTNAHPVGSQIELLGHPAVSPDGTRLLITAPSPEGLRIYVVSAGGGTPAPLGEAECAEPAWSPNGQQIVFTSFRTGNAELCRMGADGSGITRLTTNLDDDGGAAW